MAQAKKVKIGQVWKDSKGRELEVTAAQGADGKFLVRNLATGRTLKRGPRALASLVRAAPATPATPGVTSAVPAAPSRRRPPRQMSEAQRAIFGKRRKAARSMGIANPVQEPHYPLDAFRGGGPLQPGASPFRNPWAKGRDGVSQYVDPEDWQDMHGGPLAEAELEAASQGRAPLGPNGEMMWSIWSDQHGGNQVSIPAKTAKQAEAAFYPRMHEFGIQSPDEYEARIGGSFRSYVQPNPSHYPSELAKFVCQQISQMDPRYAEVPAMIMRQVAQAISQWTSQQQRRAVANPYGYGRPY